MRHTLKRPVFLALGPFVLAALLSGCNGKSTNAHKEDDLHDELEYDPIKSAAADPAAEKAAEDAVLAVGGLVRRDESHPGHPVVFVSLVATKGQVDDNARQFRPMTQVREVILQYTTASDAALVNLKELNQINFLRLHGTNVTDAGLENLAGMNRMRTLVLSGTKVRGSGLVHLNRMENLMVLDLQGAPVDDDSLVHLKGLQNLKSLDLLNSRVTGPGLVHLHGLKKLKGLQVGGNVSVSPDAVKQLRSALPNLRVVGAD